MYSNALITAPPTHSVGGPVLFCSLASVVVAVCRLSSCVTLHGEPAGGFTRTDQAMTSCRLQSNYSSTVTRHGGPVELRPVRATTCFIMRSPLVGICKGIMFSGCPIRLFVCLSCQILLPQYLMNGLINFSKTDGTCIDFGGQRSRSQQVAKASKSMLGCRSSVISVNGNGNGFILLTDKI